MLGQLVRREDDLVVRLVGDQVIVLSFALMEPEEAKNYKAKIIHLDEKNKIKK